MNETIIKNWNKVVSEDDTVYHLGDFVLGDKSIIPDLLERLNGYKEFLMGNHDNLDVMLETCQQGLIENISWEEVIKVGKKTIILNHFLFGSLPDPLTSNSVTWSCTPDKPWNHFDNQYDVGMDNNNFTPVNLADLLDKIHYKIHIK